MNRFEDWLFGESLFWFVFVGFPIFCAIVVIGFGVPIYACIRVYRTVQNRGSEIRIVDAVVIDHAYRESYTSSQIILAGKMIVPQTVTHPPEWYVVVKAEGFDAVSVWVSEGTYYGARDGDHVALKMRHWPRKHTFAAMSVERLK